MRLHNTSGIPTDSVREVIRFVCPAGVTRIDIEVKKCSGAFGGRSYSHGCAFHRTANPLVTARIGPERYYPRAPDKDRQPGYLPLPWIASRLEALVYIMAHELRHQWQAKHPRGYRVWGARGQYSERDADAYAIHMLRAWRRREVM